MNKHTLKSLMQKEPSALTYTRMTEEKIQEFVRENTQVLNEEKGYISFSFQGVKLALLSDVDHDRMRIISPITIYSNLAPKVKETLMHSNFHLALDARYAVSEDTLYSCFIHRLSSLTLHDLESAIVQVLNLRVSFGKTYSSGQLEFTHKK